MFSKFRGWRRADAAKQNHAPRGFLKLRFARFYLID